MIGVFDSGLGGLTILRALTERFPHLSLIYLGDHANVPYGDRPSHEIVALTRAGVERLFSLGCQLVLLGCNTATAIAARELQQNWLPASGNKNHNLLGIIAPMVEAATQTPWAVTTPQYPQKYNTDTIIVFATSLTVRSQVYIEEIAKRCPKVDVHQQACPGLVDAIERGASTSELSSIVRNACEAGLALLDNGAPERVILGCTHYPIVEHLFAEHLPASTRILSQPTVVADSLDDYLQRHPEFATGTGAVGADTKAQIRLLTTGQADQVAVTATRIWPNLGTIEHVD